MPVFDNENYQTPPAVCDFMVGIMRKYTDELDIQACPDTPNHNHVLDVPGKQIVLEPTPGKGYLVAAILKAGYECLHPPAFEDYYVWIINNFEIRPNFGYILMNPPFNPIKEMERFVNETMERCDNAVILLPWNYIINSERRLNTLISFGMVSVTSLPRKTFPGCRVQTCIVHLRKDHSKFPTEFNHFTF